MRSLLKRLLLSRYTWIILPIVIYLLRRFTLKAIAEVGGTVIQPTDLEESDDDDTFV